MLYLGCVHYVYRRGAEDFFGGGGGLKSFGSEKGGMVKFLKVGRGDANFLRCHRKIKYL